MAPLIFGNSQIGGSPCNVSAPKRLTTFWSVCGNGTLCACMPFHSSSLNNSKTGAKPKPKQHELKQHSARRSVAMEPEEKCWGYTARVS